MSKNLDLSLRLNYRDGNFSAGIGRATSQMHNFSSSAQSGLGKITAQVRRLNSELNGFSTITKMAGGYFGFQAMKSVFDANLDFSKNLLEMKQTGEMSAKQMAGAKAAIMKLSGEMLQTPQEMLDGLRAFTTAGEKYEFALAAVGETARTATAFFSRPVEIANMDVDLKQKMGLGAEDLKSAHNRLLYHARSGRYETKAMSMDAPRTLNTMAQVGLTGMPGVNLMGALTQRLMRLAPTTQPAEVATYMEHFMGHLTQPHYVKGLMSAGINVKKFMPGGKFGGVDKDGNAIGGQKAVDGFLSFLDALNKKGLTDPFKMGEAGFREMYTQKAAMQSLQDVGELRKALTAGDEAAKNDLVGAAFAEIKQADFGKVKMAEIEVEKMKLSGAATGGTGIVADAMGWASEHKAATALGVGGALMGGRFLWNKFTGVSGGSGGFGGALGSHGAVQSVYVSNWPAGMLSPGEALRQKRDGRENTAIGGAVPAGSTPTQTRVGMALGGFKGALKFGAPLAVGLGAWDAYQISSDDSITEKQKNDAYGKVAGGTVGGLVGAGIGGSIGALFGGVGAIPGAMVGGAIGDIIGEKIAAWMQQEKSVMSDFKEREPVRVIVDVQHGNITAWVNEANTRTARRN